MKFASTLAAVCILAAPVAVAQNAKSAWSHKVKTELTYDRADETDVGALKAEYGFVARIASGWTLEGSATLEPIEKSVGDSWFEGEDAYLEGLSVRYATIDFGVSAGKIAPVFGSAAGLAPGLYGAKIGESYELLEKVGVAGDLNLSRTILGGATGDHVLSAAVFTNDRSALSGSVAGKRERLRLEDGGVGNTEGPESVAVSLDGIYESGLGYTVGWRRLPGALASEADETGYVAGVSHGGLAAGDYGVELLAEAAHFQNAEGVDGENRTDVTVSATVRRGAWHGSSIVSGSRLDGSLGAKDTARLELTAGRELGRGVTLDAGVMWVDKDGKDSTVAGLKLTWVAGKSPK